MNKFTGILSSTATNDIDFNEVESVLGFNPNTLLDITFVATVTVSGEYIPQSYWLPAQYEEISDTEIIEIYFNFESGEILATPEQLRIMETFKPESQEVYWDLVQKETA
jgi:hypothetical protein